QQMVNQALDWLDVRPGERVLDLFCGVGNFTLPLARAGALVTGVEGSAEMVERAAANARLNGLESVHFFQADLSNSLDSAWLHQDYDAALLDPPRDGAAQMAGMLAQKRVQRILYVSCNPATLPLWHGMQAFCRRRVIDWCRRVSWTCSPRLHMWKPWHSSCRARIESNGTSQSRASGQPGWHCRYRRLD